MKEKSPALDIFALRDSVINEYKRFATSFTTIHAPDIKAQVEAIYAKDRYWPEPLIQINPSYKRSTGIRGLVDGGALDPVCADIFQVKGAPLNCTSIKNRRSRLLRPERATSSQPGRAQASGCLLHSDRPTRPRRKAKGRSSQNTRHHHLPDECAGKPQLEELGGPVPATSLVPRPSRSRAIRGRKAQMNGSGLRTTLLTFS